MRVDPEAIAREVARRAGLVRADSLPLRGGIGKTAALVLEGCVYFSHPVAENRVIYQALEGISPPADVVLAEALAGKGDLVRACEKLLTAIRRKYAREIEFYSALTLLTAGLSRPGTRVSFALAVGLSECTAGIVPLLRSGLVRLLVDRRGVVEVELVKGTLARSVLEHLRGLWGGDPLFAVACRGPPRKAEDAMLLAAAAKLAWSEGNPGLVEQASRGDVRAGLRLWREAYRRGVRRFRALLDAARAVGDILSQRAAEVSRRALARFAAGVWQHYALAGRLYRRRAPLWPLLRAETEALLGMLREHGIAISNPISPARVCLEHDGSPLDALRAEVLRREAARLLRLASEWGDEWGLRAVAARLDEAYRAASLGMGSRGWCSEATLALREAARRLRRPRG